MQNKMTVLTPRQNAYMRAYTDPTSLSFGNSYKSALAAGYSDQTARNFTPSRTEWMSDYVGQASIIIEPDDIMRELTAIINSTDEPTIVRLKAIEMTMKAYSMMVQHREKAPQAVTLNIDLSGNA
jgi:hypothetical protein